MTLTNPEWSLTVENETHPWAYETFPGDLNPPYGPVWLSADDFAMAWAFANDTSPGPLNAATFQISLSCETAADVPEIDYGDQLVVTLTQPDGALSRDPGTGIVTGDYGDTLAKKAFWVTDLEAIDEAGRMLLTITATSAVPDITIEVRAYLNDRAAAGDPSTTTMQTYAEYVRSVSLPYANDPYPALVCHLLTYENAVTMPDNLPVRVEVLAAGGVDGHTGVGLKIGEQIGLYELLDGAHALWLAPWGWDGRAHGAAFVWDTEYSPGLPNPESNRRVVSYPWDPESNAPTAAPFELTYVAAVLDSELLEDFTPAAAGSTLAILNACLIHASPQWRKDIAGAVGIAQYQGHSRISADPDDDTALTVQGTQPDARGVRQIPSLAYLGNSLTPAIGFEASGSRAAADAVYLTDAPGNGWVPESFDVLPKVMTDAEWTALGRMFWPEDERQHTLVLVNVDTDDDMAQGPVWLTLVGCQFTMDDGHLVIAPTCRPFAPAAVNGITDPATWSELDTAHPAATFAQAAGRLTWSQAKVSSL